MSEEDVKAIAHRIAAKMFTNGFNERASRLVLVKFDGTDLGGWCFTAVRDIVANTLMERATPADPPRSDAP